MKKSLLWMLGLFALTACGGGTPPPQTPETGSARVAESEATPEAPSQPTSVDPSLPFEARGTEATEDLAYAAASQRLLVALLNDETLVQEDPVHTLLAEVVHSRDANLFEQKAEEGKVVVRIGLAEGELSAALSRLEQALPHIELRHVPRALRQAIVDLRGAHLRNLLCERERELLEQTECEAMPTEPALRVVKMLASQVELQPQFEGGVPAQNGQFLRPLVVSARMQELGKQVPLERLPLFVHVGESEPVPERADEEGRMTHQLSGEVEPTTTLEVRVDSAALLGRFAQDVEFPELTTAGRTVGLERAALVFDPSSLVQRETAQEVERALRRTVTKPPRWSPAQQENVRRLTPRRWKKELPKMADALGGSLDVVLFVDAESEFASRMGTHRVWFEARGTLTAVSAWTGEKLGSVDAVTTESGVGEMRAEQAARKALGQQLAKKLLEEMKRSAAP